MLKLTAKGDYGLLLLGHLASLQRGEYISLAAVATERHLPLRYLERVAHSLLVHGLVTSRLGKDGGYALARPAHQLMLAAILEALEGSLAPVRCTHDGRCCVRQSACERKTGFQLVHGKLYQLLSGYSLADILPRVAKLP